MLVKIPSISKDLESSAPMMSSEGASIANPFFFVFFLNVSDVNYRSN